MNQSGVTLPPNVLAACQAATQSSLLRKSPIESIISQQNAIKEENLLNNHNENLKGQEEKIDICKTDPPVRTANKRNLIDLDTNKLVDCGKLIDKDNFSIAKKIKFDSYGNQFLGNTGTQSMNRTISQSNQSPNSANLCYT